MQAIISIPPQKNAHPPSLTWDTFPLVLSVINGRNDDDHTPVILGEQRETQKPSDATFSLFSCSEERKSHETRQKKETSRHEIF